MTTNRRVLTEGFVALIVAFALVALAAVATRGTAKPDMRPSTYVDSPQGLRALFLLFEGVGVDVTRLHHSPTTADDTDRTIAIVAPTWPMSAKQIDDALDWVEAGGRLVVVEAKEIEGAPARDASAFFARLGREVTNVTVLTTTSEGGDAVVEDESLRRGVEEIRWFPPVRISLKADGPPPDPRIDDTSVLASCNGSTVIERLSFGEGTIVLVSDDAFLTNVGLRQDDNAILAVNLFAGDPAGPVAIDEFHHGADEGGSRLTLVERLLALTTSTWVGRGVLIAVLALLVGVAGRAIRFGAPLPEPPIARRSLTEHAAALGRLLERGRATDSAARALIQGTRRDCARRAGATRNASPEDLERSLRASPVAGAADLADALAEMRTATKVQMAPALFQQVAARLAAARRRFLHG